MSKNLVSPTGKVVTVDDADVGQYLEAGYTAETIRAEINRETTARREADNSAGGAVALGVLAGASAGGSNALFRAIGGDEGISQVNEVIDAHPGYYTGGEVVGNLAATAVGVGPVGAAAKLGTRIARVGEGASTAARVGRAAAGASAEGAILGIGSGVSELALSETPVSVERAVSTLSSRALYGGAIGGAAGTLGKGVEIGLSKARTAITEVAEQGAARSSVADDLASLDRKGLAAAEVVEKEAIEATRAVQRKELAEEITSFRRELKTNKQFLTTKDVDLPAVGEKLGAKELGRIAMKANKQLDNVLDNPTGLMKNPAKALDALQRQENALAKLAERADDLRGVFAADTSGTRMAALDTVAPALERNRALQAKITSLTGEAASPRLAQIANAKDVLATAGAAPKSLAEQMAGGGVFSAVTGLVAALPIPGAGLLAPLLGARAAGMVGEKVFGRLGKAMTEGAARQTAAIGKLFAAGERVAKATPPVATRVLSAVAFAPERAAPAGGKRRLPELYKERSAELREQVAAGPTGLPMVRPAARARIAANLAPIAVQQPLLADRMETLAVRRLEFLAGKMPRRPEIGAMQIGPDRWEPSDMQMRTFARYVAATEDPDGIVERLAQGAVTPEDAEVMREVYPEQLADITRQILERLPTLSRTLPYQRRLALSVLTGVAVDPSMDPRILAVLQGQFAAEPESPKASPQFGSVSTKAEIGTPSERREQRT